MFCTPSLDQLVNSYLPCIPTRDLHKTVYVYGYSWFTQCLCTIPKINSVLVQSHTVICVAGSATAKISICNCFNSIGSLFFCCWEALPHLISKQPSFHCSSLVQLLYSVPGTSLKASQTITPPIPTQATLVNLQECLKIMERALVAEMLTYYSFIMIACRRLFSATKERHLRN